MCSQMSTWFAQFGAKGTTSQQRPSRPSAASQQALPVSVAVSEETVDGPDVDMDSIMARMQRANTPDLQLPNALSNEVAAEWGNDAEDAVRR